MSKRTRVKWKQEVRGGKSRTFTQDFDTKKDADIHVKRLRNGAKELKKPFKLIDMKELK